MNSLFILIVVFTHFSVIFSYNPYKEPKPEEPAIGPKGMPYNKTTSCQEFGKYARFNPYSVINFNWFVFYYWDTPKPPMSFVFRTPTTKDIQYIRYLMLNRVADNFNWKAPMLLMIEMNDQSTHLLVEVGDRGQYHLYNFEEALPLGTLYQPLSVRLKQVGANKYIGLMICRTRTAFILSKIQEVPRKEHLQTEAAKLGYYGRKGKSYLYQGHEWMPIMEADEFEFWSNYNSPRESKKEEEFKS